MATQQQHQRYDSGNSRSSRQIQSDIAETRREMDDTLHELGERLHPKHLLDHVLDYFRSNSASGAAHDAQAQLLSASRQVARQVKQHPVPYALIAAGAVWWMLEGGEEDEPHEMGRASGLRPHSGSYVDARTGQPYDDSYEEEWEAAVPWHPEYNWSSAPHDEETWQKKARAQLDSLKTTLQDTSRSATDKLKQSAASLLAISGRKKREIHARWADLAEHSGSFVDARTGEPYDETYGREWQHLAACDYFADHQEADKDTQSWSDKAGEVVEQIRSSLAAGGDNVKHTVSDISSKIGAFGQSTGAVARSSGGKLRRGTGRLGRGVAVGVQHAGSRAADGMHRLAGSAQHAAGAAQQQLRRGYDQTRRQIADTAYAYPLAAGAAVLGMGLLAGFLLPRTRAEDHWMGETSDEVKERAQETAEEALHRGKRVASATASAAMDEARKQGLTPENVGSQARQKIAETAEKAEKQVEKASRKISEKAGKVAERATETAKNETKCETQDVRH